jgi:hypothetical protein
MTYEVNWRVVSLDDVFRHCSRNEDTQQVMDQIDQLESWSGGEGPLGETGLYVDWLLRDQGIAQLHLVGSIAGQGDWRAFFYVAPERAPSGLDPPLLHIVLVTPRGRLFLEEQFLVLLQRIADLLEDLEAG